jgi:P27 family predicted phage terminase small subunit
MAENILKRSRRGAAAPPPVRVVDVPDAPAHLTGEARGMWDEIVTEWAIGADGLPLLRAALESWDLYQAARAQVAQDGPTVTTGEGGMVRQHPAVKTQMDALREFRMCFRQLGLEPPR